MLIDSDTWVIVPIIVVVYLDASHRFPHHLGFMLALGELRALFGLQIAYLAIEYGLDIENELAQIIPPELRGDVDYGRDGG